MTLIEASGIVDPWASEAQRVEIDQAEFRQALSHFASGVIVVTGLDADGRPAGLTCQSFTSLSLDPPLVLISPAKSSKSWPSIAAGGRFVVNILGDHQREVSGVFARSGTDKFAHVSWREGASGLPVLDEALAVIECDIDDIHHGGDHWIVTGAVQAISSAVTEAPPRPLLYFRSAYRGLDAETIDHQEQRKQGAS